MAWLDVLAKLKFYDEESYTLTQTYADNFAISSSPLGETVQSAIRAALQNLYSTSDTAEYILNQVTSAGDVLIAEAVAVNQLAFEMFGDRLIAFNWGNVLDTYIFNNHGELVLANPALTVIHEIMHLHGESGLSDFMDQSEAELNESDSDQRGEILDLQNAVAIEMSWHDNIQASYWGALIGSDARFSLLDTNVSYTDGNDVNLVRLGGNGAADTLDHSTRVTQVTDLMFGFGGADTILTGLGDDYAYGGSGNDLISGGDGDDVLYGEAGDDQLFGEDGNDFLDAGEIGGSEFIDGGDGFDIASFLSASTVVNIDLMDLTLNHSATGNTLTSIESLVLTNQDDVVEFSRADACIASMGGDDTVNICCNENNVEEWSHALFWAPGEGADVLNFQDWEFNYQAYPWVFILDGEADDQIQFNGMNIADVIGRADAGASVTSSSHQLFEGWYYWCVLDGQSNVVEQLTLGVSPPNEEWQGVHLSYESYVYDANSQVIDSESFDVFLGKFDSGDFGITTGESYAPDDLRTDFIEVVDAYLGLPTELISATLNSDHAWDYWVT